MQTVPVETFILSVYIRIVNQINRKVKMEEQSCENCAFRAKYDNYPKSFLGRLWRWHAGWCPGWKKYMASIPDDQRIALAEKYRLDKYK